MENDRPLGSPVVTGYRLKYFNIINFFTIAPKLGGIYILIKTKQEKKQCYLVTARLTCMLFFSLR